MDHEKSVVCFRIVNYTKNKEPAISLKKEKHRRKKTEQKMTTINSS